MFRRERETLQRLVLVPYRPFRNLSLGIGGFILIIAAGVGGFYAGTRYSSSAVGATPDEVERLRQTVRMYAEKSKAMRDKAAVAQHDRQIVLAATEQLRQENKKLLESITVLEDQVGTYKKLLSPRAGASAGLSAERLDLHGTGNPAQVSYRLVLTQASRSAGDIRGTLEAHLVGGGRSVMLPVGDNRFAFQYFQSLSGEWQLPAGFRPERVDIVLRPAQGAPVQKSFRWEVQP
ncbi:MAG: hypothetical protein K0S46_1640 [Moraxellaceae bacterium]|nr:hypothetical protein [Moraxellaceae bacterium]